MSVAALTMAQGHHVPALADHHGYSAPHLQMQREKKKVGHSLCLAVSWVAVSKARAFCIKKGVC
jgi:hypothetical protein